MAISNNRLLDIEEGHVTFRYKDYRDGDTQKTMTLTAHEFIRRFLLHVLPQGLQRIRYYGFMGNRYREEKLERCRQLLQMSPLTPTPEKTDTDVTDANESSDYRDRYEALTGVSLHVCPACGRGRMITLEQVSPSKAQDPPRVLDTS